MGVQKGCFFRAVPSKCSVGDSQGDAFNASSTVSSSRSAAPCSSERHHCFVLPTIFCHVRPIEDYWKSCSIVALPARPAPSPTRPRNARTFSPPSMRAHLLRSLLPTPPISPLNPPT